MSFLAVLNQISQVMHRCVP